MRRRSSETNLCRVDAADLGQLGERLARLLLALALGERGVGGLEARDARLLLAPRAVRRAHSVAREAHVLKRLGAHRGRRHRARGPGRLAGRRRRRRRPRTAGSGAGRVRRRAP